MIEHAGSGTPLIQDLAAESLRAIPFKPKGDKQLRMSAQSAKIEPDMCSCRRRPLGLMSSRPR